MMTFNFGYEGAYVYKDNLEVLHPIPNLSHIDAKFHGESFKDIDRDTEYYRKVLPGKKVPTIFPSDAEHIPYSYSDEHIKTVFLNNILNNAKIDLDVKFYTLDYLFLNPNIKFYYHVSLYSGEIFGNVDHASLPSLLIKCIKRGQAKILFSIVTEGFFGDYLVIPPSENNPTQTDMTPSMYFQYMHKLLDKYKLPDNSIIVISANLLADFSYDYDITSTATKKRFIILPLDWFRYSKWVNGRKYTENFLEEILNRIQEKKAIQYEKHFLCLNRVHRNHRAVMFAEFMSNSHLKDKAFISFKRNDSGVEDLFIRQLSSLKSTYKHGKDRLVHFALDYDFTKDYTLDTDKMHINLADTFASHHHKFSFVNVVTETLVSNMSIFFSEKIHKPIKAGQPFIVVSSFGFLTKMREYGYKTFSDFWDESYDRESNYTKRIEKIIDVLLEISTWDQKKCNDTYQKMIPILEHNAKVLCDDTEYFKFLSNLNYIQQRNLI